ncbi:unnamed protein product [Closterium sp. NIES-53]
MKERMISPRSHLPKSLPTPLTPTSSAATRNDPSLPHNALRPLPLSQPLSPIPPPRHPPPPLPPHLPCQQRQARSTEWPAAPQLVPAAAGKVLPEMAATALIISLPSSENTRHLNHSLVPALSLVPEPLSPLTTHHPSKKQCVSRCKRAAQREGDPWDGRWLLHLGDPSVAATHMGGGVRTWAAGRQEKGGGKERGDG